MARMKRAMVAAAAAVLVAGCAGTHQPLVVKQFTLRKTAVPARDDPMVRGEVRRLLYGAVSRSERRDRIGQYYTVLWSDQAVGAPVEVWFEYRQAATGSALHRAYQRFAAAETAGKAEFHVTGEDFRRSGRVLAWRVSLRRGPREVASRQSYLWD